MTTPTDREMLREKLRKLIWDMTAMGEGLAHDAAGEVLAEFDRYLAEYEPLRKKEPRYTVELDSVLCVVRDQHAGRVAAAQFVRNSCPNAEAEARSLAERLNAADRKEK